MKYWVPVVCGLLVGPALLAGQARGQTLNEALAAAYANSPVLRAERARPRKWIRARRVVATSNGTLAESHVIRT